MESERTPDNTKAVQGEGIKPKLTERELDDKYLVRPEDPGRRDFLTTASAVVLGSVLPGNPIENVERPLTKEQVIELLKQDPSNLQPYIDYTERRRKEIESTREKQADKIAVLEFAIEEVEIRFEAGLKEEAFEAYGDLLRLTEGLSREEIQKYQATLDRLDKLFYL